MQSAAAAPRPKCPLSSPQWGLWVARHKILRPWKLFLLALEHESPDLLVKMQMLTQQVALTQQAVHRVPKGGKKKSRSGQLSSLRCVCIIVQCTSWCCTVGYPGPTPSILPPSGSLPLAGWEMKVVGRPQPLRSFLPVAAITSLHKHFCL